MTREEFQTFLQQVRESTAAKEDALTKESLAALAADMQKSLFTIVVLGEFKRGKSTFVNALLGTPLLPMDILPETATINAIMYNETPKLSVVHMDGSQEEGEVSYEFLQRFSARRENDDELRKIKYIKIGYPLDLLQNRIVLVDTPGVSDLNQQRAEVTYQFLPKANAVIFLLDANSPLKKSEKEFIEQQLFPLGIRDIIFLANKYDCIDEEEEDEDFLGELQIRLEKAFHAGDPDAMLDKIEVYPLSAKAALDGITAHDAIRVKMSGLPAVEKRLSDILRNGDLETRKLYSYQQRLHVILKHLLRSLEARRALKEADIESLQKACDTLKDIQAEREQNKKNIRAYAEKAKENIYAMTDKSIHYFQQRLTEEVVSSVASYRGEDFKEFVEQNVVRSIRYNFENWTRTYSPCIDEALQKMGQELSYGISWYFKQKVRIETDQGEEMKPVEALLSLDADDVSVVNTQVGIAAAVGAAGLLAVMGSVVMPLIGMAAIPYFRRKMLKERLESAKAEVIPSIEGQIADTIMRLQQETHHYIDQQTEHIIVNTEYAYQVILDQLQENFRAELEKRQASRSSADEELHHIDRAIEEIHAWGTQLTK